MPEPLIQIDNLVKTYETVAGPLGVLERIDLEVGKGDFIALVGPSGGGKTTSLNMITGVETHLQLHPLITPITTPFGRFDGRSSSVNCPYGDDRSRSWGSSMVDTYRFRVKGHLDDRWSERLGGLAIQLQEDGTSVLEGPVVDQAALHGVIIRIRDLGLPLLSVKRAFDGSDKS